MNCSSTEFVPASKPNTQQARTMLLLQCLSTLTLREGWELARVGHVLRKTLKGPCPTVPLQLWYNFCIARRGATTGNCEKLEALRTRFSLSARVFIRLAPVKRRMFLGKAPCTTKLHLAHHVEGHLTGSQ